MELYKEKLNKEGSSSEEAISDSYGLSGSPDLESEDALLEHKEEEGRSISKIGELYFKGKGELYFKGKKENISNTIFSLENKEIKGKKIIRFESHGKYYFDDGTETSNFFKDFKEFCWMDLDL